jgi:peptide/nickel transport system permease protein
MLRYIARRLLWAIPTLLIITFLVYCALRMGTDPLKAYLRINQRASRAKIDQYVEKNGLYHGFNGYVKGYFKWLGGFMQGPDHWARSIKGNRYVYHELKDAVINSIRLGGAATLVGIFVGLSLGVFVALRPGSLRDATVNTASFIGLSIPPFVSAVLLQMIFSYYWKKWSWTDVPILRLLRLPTSGIYPPGHKGFDLLLMIKYMTLPVIVVSIQIIAIYARYMRASLLEVLNSDYMRTARSKGISERRVLVRHALRNALIPVVTVAAIDIGGILGGLIITERIFQYPGMGNYFLGAFAEGDFPLLMPWMVVVVLAVILFNLLADLSYAWLDPRIRRD